MEVPPPFVNLKVSRGQRGGAIPGRRSLEGVGGVLGSWGIFGKRDRGCLANPHVRVAWWVLLLFVESESLR